MFEPKNHRSPKEKCTTKEKVETCLNMNILIEKKTKLRP
jgi:hypothetical protein